MSMTIPFLLIDFVIVNREIKTQISYSYIKLLLIYVQIYECLYHKCTYVHTYVSTSLCGRMLLTSFTVCEQKFKLVRITCQIPFHIRYASKTPLNNHYLNNTQVLNYCSQTRQTVANDTIKKTTIKNKEAVNQILIDKNKAQFISSGPGAVR